MDNKNGRTFWDLVHENNSVKYSLIGIVVIILIGIIFFVSKGYSISTTGITPPSHGIVDSILIKQDSISAKIPKQKISNPSINNEISHISKLIWIVIFIQLLAIPIFVLVQSFSKNTKNNYVGSIEKKVAVFEFVYTQYIAFTLYDRGQSNELLTEIQKLSKYTLENGLYIDKQLMKLINEFTDYFKEVIVDYRTKDFKKEQIFQSQFKRIFK
jgi:hypothetical protein